MTINEKIVLCHCIGKWHRQQEFKITLKFSCIIQTYILQGVFNPLIFCRILVLS